MFQEKSIAVLVLQRAVRTFLRRRQALRQQFAALGIQRVWRGHCARKTLKQLKLEKAMQKQIEAVKFLQV